MILFYIFFKSNPTAFQKLCDYRNIKEIEAKYYIINNTITDIPKASLKQNIK